MSCINRPYFSFSGGGVSLFKISVLIGKQFYILEKE
jgi:hypothetical protein